MSNTQVQLRRGTTEENENFVGAEGELVYDTEKKQLRIHDGEKVGGFSIDPLVAFQVPTEENGYTWYRKYASGWVEQGGVYTNSSSVTGFATTVDLPIEMADENYTANCNVFRKTADASNRHTYQGVYYQGTTQIGIGWYGGGSFQFCEWTVKGMAKVGE